MKCKNHPNRDANHFCTSCSIPICDDCTEQTTSGEAYCFQCAMLQAVSGVGTSLTSKREKASEKELEKKKEKGPFHYFVIASSVLIVVMWGVIIFGGQEAPGSKIDFSENPRIFLFMVDSSIKRYAHFEGNNYPNTILDIIPKYLKLIDEEMHYLSLLSYNKDPNEGYRLSYSNPQPGEMNIIISPKGIKYETALGVDKENE
jgi:hypothetical protein